MIPAFICLLFYVNESIQKFSCSEIHHNSNLGVCHNLLNLAGIRELAQNFTIFPLQNIFFHFFLQAFISFLWPEMLSECERKRKLSATQARCIIGSKTLCFSSPGLLFSMIHEKCRLSVITIYVLNGSLRKALRLSSYWDFFNLSDN